MYQSTLEGRFLSVDPLFAEMLGYGSAREMMENISDIGAQLYVEPDARTQLLERLMTWGAVSNLENQVYRKDGRLWHRESLLAEDAPDVILHDVPVTYVVGSGAHAQTFLAQIDQSVFPLHEGVYYAFVCQGCRTTATTYQQT